MLKMNYRSVLVYKHTHTVYRSFTTTEAYVNAPHQVSREEASVRVQVLDAQRFIAVHRQVGLHQWRLPQSHSCTGVTEVTFHRLGTSPHGKQHLRQYGGTCKLALHSLRTLKEDVI